MELAYNLKRATPFQKAERGLKARGSFLGKQVIEKKEIKEGVRD